MSKELAISASRHETRVAIIEDDLVAEVYYQREQEYSLAGSIHKGRVTRVLPGMQSAFVDIGLDRDAFLYVSDFFEDNEEYDKIVTGVEEKVFKLDRRPPAAAPQAAAPADAEPGAGSGSSQSQTPPEAQVPGAEAQAAGTPAPREEETVRMRFGPEDGGEREPEEAGQNQAETAASPGAAAPYASLPPRRDDGDRRGRRGRRRRGQKGGRGLPESKFYSPGGRAPSEYHAPRESFPPAPAGDFLVLPGESLARHRADALRAGAPIAPLTAEEEMEVEAAERAAEEAQQAEAESGAREAEALAAPPADEREAIPAAERLPEAEPADEQQSEPESAEDVDVEVTDAAEPAEASEPDEPSHEAEAEATELEPVEAEGASQEGGSAEEPEPAAGGEEAATAAGAPEEGAVAGTEGEGPEPARIPTSLTAALREQGARYPHRVSRRSRRRGRDRERPPLAGEAPRPYTAAPPEARVQEAGPRPGPAAADLRPEKAAGPSITDLLKEGQEIIVQIAKEPLGHKGARITSHIALPGRFLVYMPTVDHVGVSRKIPSDEERMRLKRILQSNRTGITGGYIVRTAGEGRSEEELRADMMFLYNLWLDLRQRAERKPAPALIHHDLGVVERILRDQLTPAFKTIWTDNEEVYESVVGFVERFQPALIGRVKMYTRATPMFDEFGITAEIEKALRPKVWLKSGGHIVINQTEALVAIDVNTGKFVGKSNRLEDTIVKVNTDAIKEIVRQIRLRDLGGIIVVDFIDMDERKNRQKVMQALEEAMRADRAPYKILQFNDFGLVAITRKRVKQSLERTLCTPCPYCEGSGYIKSPQTVVGEILQEAHKIARALEGKDVMLRVNPEVAKLLKSNQNTYLQEIEEVLGRTVIVKTDPQLNQERFDLA
jgi:ribonuclease G